MSIVLQHDESGLIYSSTFNILALKGLDEPDSIHKIAVLHEYLSGTLEEQVAGFRKEPITISFKPPYTEIQSRFLVKWFTASVKRIVYQGLISEGVTDDALVSKWLYDCERCRAFDVQFFDEHVYHYFEIIQPASDTDMYLKRDVEITGTYASPEVFTTNVGKLALMQNGSAWPAFNASTHDFIIIPEPGCSTLFSVVKSSVAVVAGNLTFQALISDVGFPAADGKFYTSIAIGLIAK